MRVKVTVYHDKRHKKSSGSFPVKLRVYDSVTQQTKHLSTDIDLSEEDFKRIWINRKVRKELQPKRFEIEKLKTNAQGIANSIEPFSFKLLEKKMNGGIATRLSIRSHYSEIIEELKEDRYTTSLNYSQSLNSLLGYQEAKYGKKDIFFSDITPNWLQAYENYMLNEKGFKRTTVGIYLRPLRAIFNKAIHEKDIDSSIYPFGKSSRKLYQIPSSQKLKKALNKKELSTLWNTEPDTPEQERAKDFWFFSYMCNGMNIKDMALLEKSNVQGDRLVFFRSKTKNTAKENQPIISVPITEHVKRIIDKYSTNSDQKYLFPILKDGLNSKETDRRIKNFNRSVNTNLKYLCRKAGVTDEVSTIWARHSFATNAINSGANKEFVQESLGHMNSKTTERYFAGFEDDFKKEMAIALMDL